MSSDYNYEIVTDWETMNGIKVPINEHGHYLDHTTVTPVVAQRVWNHKLYRYLLRSPRQVAIHNTCFGESQLGNKRKFWWAEELTNPYGLLEYAIGTGDDFHCFDYDSLPDGRIVLDATVNSETGCFIDGAGYEVVSKEDAPNIALGMIDNAMDWEGVRHNKSGWNQDPYYFYRSVYLYCHEDAPKFSDREQRMGGDRINKFCQLSMLTV